MPRTIKVKKEVLEQPAVEQQALEPETVNKAPRTIKVKKSLPIPPPPVGVYITKAMEAFEALREYYRLQEMPIPDEDITWYHEELAREAAEMKVFWEEECNVTKAVSDAIFRGATDDELFIIEANAKLKEKKRPITEDDIGEMPAHGTREFWVWCAKRKQLRLQKEAAIIAAGGTVKAPKPKAPKAQKPKVQNTNS